MKKNVTLYSEQAREAILSGVNKIANAVRTTLGPGGRNVVISQGNEWVPPRVTKDGVTVARSIFLEDPAEALGAQLLKQAASTTNDRAGDGTSSSTVLAQAIIIEGLKQVGLQRNGVRLKEGIEKAARDAVEALDLITSPIELTSYEDLLSIATVSGNDEEVGKTVADAFTKVGKNGVVAFQPGSSNETTVDIAEGMCFDQGLQSPYFMTDLDKMEAVMKDNVKVLIFEDSIRAARDIHGFLEKFVKTFGASQKLLIVGDVDGEALGTLALNKVEKGFLWMSVKTPGHGARALDWMRDIAALTNATVITKELGTKIENVDLIKHLGTAEKVVITQDTTTIFGTATQEEKDAYVELLLSRKDEVEDFPFKKEFYEIRIAKLTSGIAVINIGAATGPELDEKKYRYEDSISATKAALAGGIVAGGGVALLRIQSILKQKKRVFADEDTQVGYDLFLKALTYPAIIIAENAGYNGGHVLEMISDPKIITGKRGRPNRTESFNKKTRSAYGFNARTGEYVDMFEAGIIDPAQVTKQVITNAASVAGTILTTEAIIFEVKDPVAKS